MSLGTRVPIAIAKLTFVTFRTLATLIVWRMRVRCSSVTWTRAAGSSLVPACCSSPPAAWAQLASPSPPAAWAQPASPSPPAAWARLASPSPPAAWARLASPSPPAAWARLASPSPPAAWARPASPSPPEPFPRLGPDCADFLLFISGPATVLLLRGRTLLLLLGLLCRNHGRARNERENRCCGSEVRLHDNLQCFWYVQRAATHRGECARN